MECRDGYKASFNQSKWRIRNRWPITGLKTDLTPFPDKIFTSSRLLRVSTQQTFSVAIPSLDTNKILKCQICRKLNLVHLGKKRVGSTIEFSLTATGLTTLRVGECNHTFVGVDKVLTTCLRWEVATCMSWFALVLKIVRALSQNCNKDSFKI